MALNRQAVITYVRQQPPTNFIDINRTVALISDGSKFVDNWKLFMDMDGVKEDFTNTDVFYKMAEAYFNEAGGSGYLYAVPVRKTLTEDEDTYPDVIQTLTDLENDAGLVWAMVIADKAINDSHQVITGQVAASKYKEAYHMLFQTNDASAKTSATTDPASVNKTVYDSLSGENSKLVGNMSYCYTANEDEQFASKIAGAMMGVDIGNRTVKFMKPLLMQPETLTPTELQFLMDKNINVYTSTNEMRGKTIVKEGMCLKQGNFIDTSLGAIWIEVNLTSICYDLFQQEKVTIDGVGFALLENATVPVFKQAQLQRIIQDGDDAYTIKFKKDASILRGIIGDYSFKEAVAGHFLTNNVEIK